MSTIAILPREIYKVRLMTGRKVIKEWGLHVEYFKPNFFAPVVPLIWCPICRFWSLVPHLTDRVNYNSTEVKCG